MKKTIIILIVLSLAVSLFGCNGGNNTNPNPSSEITATTKPNETSPAEKTADPTTEPTATAVPTDTPEPTPTPIKGDLISVNKPVTASNVQNDYKVEYINDGESNPDDSNERWSGYNGKYKNYVIIDFESYYDFTSIDVEFEVATLYYKIYVSDTTDVWTEIYDSYANDFELGTNAYDTARLNATGRYLKLESYVPDDAKEDVEDYISGSFGGYCWFSIFEWSVYGVKNDSYEPTYDPTAATPIPESGALLSKNKEAMTNNVEATHVAANAFDGKPNTRWAGYTTDGPEDVYLGVDLGAVYTITKVLLDFEFDGRYYVLEVSDTGEEGSYKTFFDSYDADFKMGAGAEHEIELTEPVTGRYVRIRTDRSELSTGERYFSLYEMEIYGK